MRETRQSGSEGGGDGTTVSSYPYPKRRAPEVIPAFLSPR
jgi:hypothetical protein